MKELVVWFKVIATTLAYLTMLAVGVYLIYG